MPLTLLGLNFCLSHDFICADWITVLIDIGASDVDSGKLGIVECAFSFTNRLAYGVVGGFRVFFLIFGALAGLCYARNEFNKAVAVALWRYR